MSRGKDDSAKTVLGAGVSTGRGHMTTDHNDVTGIKSTVRGGPIHGLVLGGVVLIVAIVIGTATMVGNFRERALSSSERELENTVLLLSRHFDQQLEDFEVVQKDIIAQMRIAGIDTG